MLTSEYVNEHMLLSSPSIERSLTKCNATTAKVVCWYSFLQCAYDFMVPLPIRCHISLMTSAMKNLQRRKQAGVKAENCSLQTYHGPWGSKNTPTNDIPGVFALQSLPNKSGSTPSNTGLVWSPRQTSHSGGPQVDLFGRSEEADAPPGIPLV